MTSKADQGEGFALKFSPVVSMFALLGMAFGGAWWGSRVEEKLERVIEVVEQQGSREWSQDDQDAWTYMQQQVTDSWTEMVEMALEKEGMPIELPKLTIVGRSRGN